MYRRSLGGGSVCVDAFTVFAVLGGVVLLQFLFHTAVSAACSSRVSLTSLRTTHNTSYVLNVDNANVIDVEMLAGDQNLMQDQTQMQDLTQMQSQTQSPVQTADQFVSAPQMQQQSQTQSQRQDDFVTLPAGGNRLRQEDLTDDCMDLTCDDPEDEAVLANTDYSLAEEETGEAAQPTAGGQARRRRRWTLGLSALDLSNLVLSDLSYNLCSALGVYHGR